MNRMQRFIACRVEGAGLVDVQREVDKGNFPGAAVLLETICASDPQNAKTLRDRFSDYVFKKNLEAAAAKKKEARPSSAEQARKQWADLFSGVEAI